jgi:probable rRNA maturation factor
VKKVKEWAQKILKQLGLERKELSILLVDDEEIKRLNSQYLGRKRPTNVIAFPMDGPNEHLLGDIVISTERAQKEAEKLNLPFEEHLARLLIHGILHLLGYEDQTKSQYRKMRQKEEELLQYLFSKPFPEKGV